MGAKTGWYSSSLEGTIGNTDFPEKRNASGFTALPGGCRDLTGLMGNQTTWGYWWTATDANTTDAIFRYLRENGSSDYSSFISENCGLSVRCIKNNEPTLPTVSTSIFTCILLTSSSPIICLRAISKSPPFINSISAYIKPIKFIFFQIYKILTLGTSNSSKYKTVVGTRV